MICEAFDGDVPAFDANNALDDADGDALPIEDRALFNMQFHVSRDIPRRFLVFTESLGMAAQVANAITQSLVAKAGQAHLERCNGAGPGAAPGLAAFLVAPHDDLERVIELKFRFVKRSGDFDGRHHTDDAVVMAAVRHRIDV